MWSVYESTRTKQFGRTSANLYLQYKWDCTNYEKHRYNVKNVESKIDNKAPRTFPHLYIKPKKLQMELERFCEIQRDNKHLMNRLAAIQRGGGWIDHKNFHEIKSLNTWKRQQEMIELSYNNQTMLKRLLDCHSVYNHHKLEGEYMLTRKHKAIVEKYPEDWRKMVFQMKCLKKRIRKKVIQAKKGKLLVHKTNEEELKIIQKESEEMEKAEKEAEQMKTVKEQERKKLERLKAIKDRKRIAEWKKEKEEKEREQAEKLEKLKAVEEKKRVAEWKKVSSGWREAREERLRLAEEKKAEEERKLAEINERLKAKREKQREETKRELEKWRKWKKENERIEKEKEKEEAEEKKRKAAEARRKNKAKAKIVVKESSSKDSFASDLTSSSFYKNEMENDLQPKKTVVFFEGGSVVDLIESDIIENYRADPISLTESRTTASDVLAAEDSVPEVFITDKESESKIGEKVSDHGLENDGVSDETVLQAEDKRVESTKKPPDQENKEVADKRMAGVDKSQPKLSAKKLSDDLKVDSHSNAVESAQASGSKTHDSSEEFREEDYKTVAVEEVDSTFNPDLSNEHRKENDNTETVEEVDFALNPDLSNEYRVEGNETETVEEIDSALNILMGLPERANEIEGESTVSDGKEHGTTDDVPFSSENRNTSELTKMNESGFGAAQEKTKGKEK